jgi:multicomponent K+:H+ antiporter subunit D
MSVSLSELMIIPIVLPLLTAALMLTLLDKRPRLKSIANVGSTLVVLLVAVELLRRVNENGDVGTYLASNWEAPFGIVLVADRLTALMLVLVGVIALGAAVYATAGWSRAGVYFHPLFQIQLMGLNGAFLTGDLFNLFVFFEVMLAASYGLQLHGSGWPRVRSGLHYIAINLLASSLFLVGLAVLYGVMGTLSMADIAAKLPYVPEDDRGLLHAGAAVLAVAFLTKAATWPLGFWLVPAYSAASAPVAALFALMTKVGIYALLRLWTLFFSPEAGASASFGGEMLVYGGLCTIVFGTVGVVASTRLTRIAGFSVIVSSGILLASVGLGHVAVTSAALFYLLSSTVAVSALFLLIELVERPSGAGDRIPLPEVDFEPGEDTNLDDNEEALVGRVIPVSLALLGISFIGCTLLIAGLPPLSGFVAKFVLMAALLNPSGVTPADAPGTTSWWLFALLLVSGLGATLSLSRAGIRHFWKASDRPPPRLNSVEALPVLALLVGCIWLTTGAESVLRYTRAAAEALHAPTTYVDTVMTTKPIPGPTRPQMETQEANP